MEITKILEFIEKGELNSVNLNNFEKLFVNNKHKCDQLQYALCKCCQKLMAKAGHEGLVNKLVEICYKDKNSILVQNPERFTACLYYISSYFIQKKMYNSAMKTSSHIIDWINDLENLDNITDNTTIAVYNLHAVLLKGAQETTSLQNNNQSFKLLKTSLEVIEKIKNEKYEKKIIKNIINYFEKNEFWNLENINSIIKYLKNYLLDKKYELIKYFILKINNFQLKVEDSGVPSNVKCVVLLCCCVFGDRSEKYWNEVLVCLFEKKEVNKFGDVYKNVMKGKGLEKDLKHLLLSTLFNHAVKLWLFEITEDKFQDFNICLIGEAFFDNFLQISTLSLLSSVSCMCTSSTNVDGSHCSAYSLSKNLSGLINVVKSCLKRNLPESTSLISVAIDAFKLSSQCIEKMTDFNCNHNLQVHSWQLAVTNMFNLSQTMNSSSRKVKLRREPCDIYSVLFESIVKNKKWPLPFEESIFYRLFNAWHQSTLNLKQFEEALKISVYYFLNYPERQDQALALWALTKLEDFSDGVQQYTVIDIINKHRDWFAQKCVNFKYSQINKQSLLIYEMRAYDAFASSKLNVAFKNVWVALNQLDTCPSDLASVLAILVAACVTCMDCEEIVSFKGHCEELITQLSKSKSKSSLVYMGQLKYCILLLKQKELQDEEEANIKSSEVILKILKQNEEEKVKAGEIADMNVTCDVMPESDKLTIEYEQKTLKLLNEAKHLWQQSLKQLDHTCFSNSEVENWLYCIKSVAYMFGLYGDLQSCLDTWRLCYEVAKIYKLSKFCLLAISQLIRYQSTPNTHPWILEAEDICKQLPDKTTEVKHIIINYYLSSAMNALQTNEPSKCYDYLCLARNLLKTIDRDVRYFAKQGRFWMISSFLMLYNKEIGAKLNLGSLRGVVYLAFSYLNSGLKIRNNVTTSQHCELLTTGLEVNVWCYEFFAVYKLTCHMRLFLENLFCIVHQLFLPTRTCHILYLLAQVDLISVKPDDCYLKLEKMKSILEVAWNCEEVKPMNTHIKQKSNLTVPEINRGSISPMVLSPTRFNDTMKITRDLSPYSKSLEADNKIYTDHPSHCECDTCLDIVIQLFKLNTLNIEGQLLTMKDQLKKAVDVYERGYEFIKLIRRRSADFTKLYKNVEVLTFVNVCISKFLINFAKFQLISKLDDKIHFNVCQILRKVEAKLGDCGLYRIGIQNELLELKMSFMEICGQLEESSVESSTSVRSVTPEKHIKHPVSKTPHITQHISRKDKAPFRTKLDKIELIEEYVGTTLEFPNEDSEEMAPKPEIPTSKVQTVTMYKTPKTTRTRNQEPDFNFFTNKTLKKVQSTRKPATTSKVLVYEDSPEYKVSKTCVKVVKKKEKTAMSRKLDYETPAKIPSKEKNIKTVKEHDLVTPGKITLKTATEIPAGHGFFSDNIQTVVKKEKCRESTYDLFASFEESCQNSENKSTDSSSFLRTDEDARKLANEFNKLTVTVKHGRQVIESPVKRITRAKNKNGAISKK